MTSRNPIHTLATDGTQTRSHGEFYQSKSEEYRTDPHFHMGNK